MSKIVWNPPPALFENSQMAKFMGYVRKNYEPSLTKYTDLYQWSITHAEQFWTSVWDFCGVIASQSWTNALTPADDMLDVKWFSGSRLNFAENLLRHKSQKTALIFHHENRTRREISYATLYHDVAKFAAALKQKGVTVNDRVAAVMPNMPETVIAMLATVSIGAIWSSCSPDFGENGLLDRFSQIQPKILIATDGYIYQGRTFSSMEKIQTLMSQIHSIEQTIVIPYINTIHNIPSLKNTILYADFMQQETTAIVFEQLPFDHPVYILYSSGTTGKPKCIVHGAGGVLLQHLKELVLHTDLDEQDIFFYFTTCSWMMWNWQISGLATGATLVLYDGAVFYPNKTRLFDVIAQEKITLFGTSAKYLSSIEKLGLIPQCTHELSSLTTILSTGSPLLPMNFDYVYQKIKPDLRLCSISGGTDIISCFALGNPLLPIYSGELQCRGLGLNVEIYNEQGESIRGEKGELVCTAPFPAMPIYFWNDPNKDKYRAAYFEKFPGVWAHGDYAELTEQDGLIIFGRSDAVLKPLGIRIGTAEIYREAETFSEITESVAIGQTWQNDIRIILFVKMQPDAVLNESLKQAIKSHIRTHLSPHHVPAKIIQVPDIPKTLNGKITELAVSNVVNGNPVRNKDVIANPEALDYFETIRELQSP
jgi:acetoacetyl-CoA synthetase